MTFLDLDDRDFDDEEVCEDDDSDFYEELCDESYTHTYWNILEKEYLSAKGSV